MNRLTNANYRLNVANCQARMLMRWAPRCIGSAPERGGGDRPQVACGADCHT